MLNLFAAQVEHSYYYALYVLPCTLPHILLWRLYWLLYLLLYLLLTRLSLHCAAYAARAMPHVAGRHRWRRRHRRGGGHGRVRADSRAVRGGALHRTRLGG